MNALHCITVFAGPPFQIFIPRHIHALHELLRVRSLVFAVANVIVYSILELPPLLQTRCLLLCILECAVSGENMILLLLGCFGIL